MAIKKLQPNLQGANLEKIKDACYPCTSQQNDCSRTLNGEQATVEGCNGAYTFFKINPPPADYSPPKKVATLGPPEKEATGVATTNSGQGSLGTVLFAAFLPMSSYSSSCILSLCSIYFVVAAASKK
jgi:hypothetical protein